MREGQLGSDLATLLRKQNAIVVPIVAGQYSMPGTPDKYVCHKRWRGWLELKVATQELRQDQLDFAKLVCERGDRYCCVTFLSRDKLKPYTRIQAQWFYVHERQLFNEKFYCEAQEILDILSSCI